MLKITGGNPRQALSFITTYIPCKATPSVSANIVTADTHNPTTSAIN